MPKLDAQRQIDAKPRNGNGAVYITSGTPILAPNPAPVMAHSGTPGQWYIGPSTLLMQAVSSTDDSIVVADDYLLDIGDEIVLSDNRAINEIATVTGGPTAAGAYWRYTIGRTDGRSFLAGGTVTSLGTEADGGYIIVNSGERGGAASKAPHINIWERAAGGDLPKLRMGKLANLPAALKAEFPGVDAEEWAAAGYGIAAAGSAYFAGKVWATGGQINGDMLIDGGTLKTLSGLGRAGVVMGENEIGYGITLQDSQGEPLFWAVSPYMEGGTVLSEVAVGIKAEGKRLLYLHKDAATDEYKLEIGVETLVDGQLQATNILAGTGTYPNAFTGMRFGAEGLQTFGTDFVEQVAIDVQDGRLYFGKREGWLDEYGLVIDATDTGNNDAMEHTITWLHQSNISDRYVGASVGSTTGQWFATVRRHLFDLGEAGAQSVDTFVEAELFLQPGNQNTSYLYAQNVDLRGEVTAALQAGSSLNPARAVLTPDGRFTTGRLTVGGSALHVTDDGQTVSVGTNSNTGARLISLADDIPVFRGLRSDGQYFAIDVRRASETWLSASGAIALLPAPGADGIGRVLPYSNPVGLGSAARKFWEVYAEKGHFGTLGSQTALAGQFYLTSKHATLAVGLEPENVVAYVREDDLAEGEFYRFEDTDGNHEEIRINTAGVLTGDGWYEYEIERAQGADLDNETGLARQWYAGDVGVSLGGNLTDGYIRLWGADDLNPNTGPAIVVYQRDNDDASGSVSERAAFGNLNGFYGYEENVYGVAFGRAAGRWVSLDDAEGLRIMQGDTQRAVYREYVQIGTSAGNNVLITDSTLALRTGETAYIEMDNAGNLDLTGTLAVATGGAITWAGGKGRADDAGLEHAEDVNNYFTVKPGAFSFLVVSADGFSSVGATISGQNVGVEGWSDGGTGVTGGGLYGVIGTSSDAGAGVVGQGMSPDSVGVLAFVANGGIIALQIDGGIVDGGSQRYTDLADAVADTDALNRRSADLRYGRRWRTWLEAA